jgi:hypothetical protein
MNKLEEKFKKEIELYTDEDFAIEESCKILAEITTDVAIKFAKWIDDSSFTYYAEENIWSSIATEEKKTSEELFKEFINIYYGK